jgi:hypothetical protein
MKLDIKLIIAAACLVHLCFGGTVDTLKQFWNSELYLDFSYGYSYLDLWKLNRDYINAFAKPFLFKNNVNFGSVLSPTFGIPLGNSIVSLSYFQIDVIHPGVPDATFLLVNYYAAEVDYRKCYLIQKRYLINPGISAFVGKGYSYVGNKTDYDLYKKNDEAFSAWGGGAGLFCDFFIKYKLLLLGPRIGANLIWTNTLSNYNGQWIIYDSGKKINLGLSGIYIVLKAGLLI